MKNLTLKELNQWSKRLDRKQTRLDVEVQRYREAYSRRAFATQKQLQSYNDKLCREQGGKDSNDR